MTRPLSILGAFLLTFTLSPHTATPLEIGDSMDDVIEELGKPLGHVERNGVVTLIYDGGGIEIKDDHVIFLPEDFLEVDKSRKKIRQYEEVEEDTLDAYEEEQFSKGLVQHEGQWVTRDERQEMIAEARRLEIQAQQDQWQRQSREAARKRRMAEHAPTYKKRTTTTNTSSITKDLDALRRSKTKTKLHSLAGEENRP